jgi:predicted dehydrogenase
MMLKVGVLGAGSLGRIHLSNWKEIDQTEITGFYESDDFIAEDAYKTFSVNRFTQADYLIDACDLIDITASIDSSFQWCEKAIRQGKHVFIEKALANSIDEAKQLVKLIKESNVKFQVGYSERFNPAFGVLQSLCPKPVFIEAQNMIRIDHGKNDQRLFYDLMTPDIDIILCIAKSDVKNINANGTQVFTDNYDIVNARIEFNNGCVASITWGRLSPAEIHRMRFYEPGKFIDIDFISNSTSVINIESLAGMEGLSAKNAAPGGQPTFEDKSIGESNYNSVKLQLEEFRNAVLNNTPPIVSAIDGLRAMDIAHQILQKTRFSC